MMFTKENQTLYLTTWDYNRILIIAELAKIVTDNGGKVKPGYSFNNGYIVNRSITQAISEAKSKAEAVKENIENGKAKDTEKAAAYLEKLNKTVAELETINNDPVEVDNGGYIRFILDGYYYGVDFPDNPFFEFWTSKTKVREDNTISRDVYSDRLETNDFLWNCFVSISGKIATKDDRREAANIIFNKLITAKESEHYTETEKRRVANTYNSGYHYETIRKPERTEKIDF